MVLRSSIALYLYLCGVLLSSCFAKPKLHFGSCRGSGQCRLLSDCLEEPGYVLAEDSSECFNTFCCLKKQPVYPQSVDNYCRHDLKPHISNGEVTKRREFPWMAMLLYGDRLTPKCGGSLVGNQWVLTAAHCVPSQPYEEDLRLVRLGVWDVQQLTDSQDIPIARTIVHEKYLPAETTGTNLEKHSNDIALLVLERVVTYSEFIQPICLPSSLYPRRGDNYVNYGLTIAGWGRTSEESTATAPVKIKARVNGWSRDSCLERYKDLADGQMCAGGDKSRKGSCFGDSGGPVMDGNQLVGIVSLGEARCGSDRGPMVVTRVDSYLAWLGEHFLDRPESPEPKIEQPIKRNSGFFNIFARRVFGNAENQTNQGDQEVVPFAL
ncbi:venom protease-like [Drosophila takahashii]|uniref:venom protease-like n=1 Tax=Drosophila takahashii TaxID=29030 RepID=UPI001CF817F8|nr:spaetzle-processing enzyme-like [Drosophila takahashii]